MTVIDPLEEAAELTDWLTFVEEIESTIPFAESTSADTDIVWAPNPPRSTPAVPGAVPGEIAYDFEFFAPWEAQLGETAVDPATGLTVPLDLKGSPISPAFEDTATHTWTVNPAYVTWAVAQGAGRPTPSVANIPAPDAENIYSGLSKVPAWEDVHQWASTKARTDNPGLDTVQSVSGTMVARAVDVAIGTTIKALSGFISQVAEATARLSQATKARIDALQLALYVVAANLSGRLQRVEAVQNLILKLAIPSLQAQITLEKHNRQVEVQRQIAAQKVWTTDHVYIPLNTDIQQNQIEANTKIQAVHDGVPDQVRELFPALIAPLAATVAGLATKVGTLEAESESCVKPMCATMGPATDLGKFLKLLKIAEWIALLTELAAIREGGLDELLGEIAGWAKTAVDHFEGAFVTDGKTLGETIAGIV